MDKKLHDDNVLYKDFFYIFHNKNLNNLFDDN